MRPFSSIRIAAEVQYPEFLRQAQLWYTQCDPPRRCINTARTPPPFATSPCLKLQRRQWNSVLRVGSVFWTSCSDGDFPRRPFFFGYGFKKRTLKFSGSERFEQKHHWVPVIFRATHDDGRRMFGFNYSLCCWKQWLFGFKWLISVVLFLWLGSKCKCLVF